MLARNFTAIYRAILLVFGLILLLMISSFSGKKLSQTSFDAHEIVLMNNAAYQLISSDEIEKIYKKNTSSNANIINISLLEDKIMEHPLVEKVEVFSSLNGKVYIQVFQKKPIARLIHSKPHKYLGENGDIFPLSIHYSVEVPLISGSLNDSVIGFMTSPLNYLNRDNFFKGFFGLISRSEKGEFFLFPEHYKHRIELGTMDNFERKMQNLKSFYLQAATEEQLKELKYINVKYKDQVICGKRN